MSDSDDPALWLRFARENLEVARMSLDRDFFNPALQNAQQAIEKSLKAVILRRNLPIPRSHNILALVQEIQRANTSVNINDAECDLIDSIYLPSKYPPDSALPHSMPDRSITEQCYSIAERIVSWAQQQI